jgi:hypothetical protein
MRLTSILISSFRTDTMETSTNGFVSRYFGGQTNPFFYVKHLIQTHFEKKARQLRRNGRSDHHHHHPPPSLVVIIFS